MTNMSGAIISVHKVLTHHLRALHIIPCSLNVITFIYDLLLLLLLVYIYGTVRLNILHYITKSQHNTKLHSVPSCQWIASASNVNRPRTGWHYAWRRGWCGLLGWHIFGRMIWDITGHLCLEWKDTWNLILCYIILYPLSHCSYINGLK